VPLNIEVAPFEPAHAPLMVDLAARAFAIVARDERPADSPALVAHRHGDANPSGRAWIAIARDGGRAVACVAALPARFRRRDGRIVVGFQIGNYVVEAAAQRQGLGGRMLGELMRELARLPDAFVYGYPNRRSYAPLERLGYVCAARIPTLVLPPNAGSILAGSATSVRSSRGDAWDLSFARGADAERAVRAMKGGEDRSPGFVRDRDYFVWRFFGPESDSRYDFALCTSRDDGRSFALAMARHRFHGVRFAIVMDAYPNGIAEDRALALRAARVAARRFGAWFAYVNTNASRSRGEPWHVHVPDARNPRPVHLLVHPHHSAVTQGELGASLAMTADWNGF
jgi:predicted N-acetyltransferase YhbS